MNDLLPGEISICRITVVSEVTYFASQANFQTKYLQCGAKSRYPKRNFVVFLPSRQIFFNPQLVSPSGNFLGKILYQLSLLDRRQPLNSATKSSL